MLDKSQKEQETYKTDVKSKVDILKKATQNREIQAFAPDADKIWEITDKMINVYEDDLVFTKQGLIDFFAKLSSEPKYRVLKAGENFSAAVSDKGTFLNEKVPCFKYEYSFDTKEYPAK